ncbi:DMT family transporter [Thalassospira marina]|uniref:EamA family transporter n=1 Tax=Thalassospira marina TaxID=2048283 RepID=A0ABM6Q9K4_9PROT|nr:DMT family transporter [Thalassospira marina]AUG53223.1 EamA family transporter [Thalassospira marina]
MTAALFAIVTFCWGFTWYAIKMQIGPIPIEISIFYRFGLAAAVLAAGMAITGRLKPVPWSAHPWIFLLGCGLFAINFILMYTASSYIASGIIAVLFTTSTIFNAIGNWLFYGQRPGMRFMGGAALGLGGIVCLFANQLASLSHNATAITGMACALGGTAVFASGNMVSVKLHKLGIPTRDAVVRGMAYGAGVLLIFGLLRGETLVMPTDPYYIGGLLYLAIPGSIIAFLAYLALVNRVGAGKAAYVTVLFPVVALTVSTFLEGYIWTATGAAGLALILLGNITIFARIPVRKRKIATSEIAQ